MSPPPKNMVKINKKYKTFLNGNFGFEKAYAAKERLTLGKINYMQIMPKSAFNVKSGKIKRNFENYQNSFLYISEKLARAIFLDKI